MNIKEVSLDVQTLSCYGMHNESRAGSGSCGFCFLAGCRKKRLNQG